MSRRSNGLPAPRAGDRPNAAPTPPAPTREANILRLNRPARALLAPAFGAAIALFYTLGWLACGRAFTPRVATAVAHLGLAATLSAGAALLAARVLASHPWSARIAAVLLCLLAGTGGLASLFMTLQSVIVFHDLGEVPLAMALYVLGISGASALYNVLSIAAPLILPLGLPLTVVFAVLIAANPR